MTDDEAGPLRVRANARRREFVAFRNADIAADISVRLGRACCAGGPVPQLSVIIPTRDGYRGGYLPRLLAQVAQQTCQDFELIIVQGDPRQGRAINTGAALARAETLLTLDDDTRLGSDRVFEQLARALQQHADIGLAGVANLIPTDAPWLMRRVMAELPRRHAPLVREITDSDLAEHPCLAMRRSVFFQVGGEHELMPRGLDPYLREAVRRAGYRVVVIPEAWIHHLPPATLPALVRQFYRNGYQAAYCNKYFPEWIIETPGDHGARVVARVPLPRRLLRYAGRWLRALVTLRWIYALTLSVYAVGFLHGWLTARPAEGET